MPDSLLQSIRLINFMSFKDVTATFDETGILNIKGFNNSGKSAFLEAVAVCLFDAYSRKQKSFIRDNEKYFRVICTFSDGVSILRDKYSDGQSLYEMYKGDALLFTTKIGDKTLGRVTGVPEPIANYLGLFQDGNFLLNVRRKSDPLLLVSTTGSENFGMLNAVLKTAELTEAASLASAEANVTSREVSDLELKLNSTTLSMNEIWVTPEILDFLKDKADIYRGILAQTQLLDTLVKAFDNFTSTPSLPEVAPISIEHLRDFIELERLYSLSQVEELPTLNPIPADRLSDLISLEKSASALISAEPAPTLNTLNPDQLDVLSRLEITFSRIQALDSDLLSLENDIKLDTMKHRTLVNGAVKMGAEVIECPNCKVVTIK